LAVDINIAAGNVWTVAVDLGLAGCVGASAGLDLSAGDFSFRCGGGHYGGDGENNGKEVLERHGGGKLL